MNKCRWKADGFWVAFGINAAVATVMQGSDGRRRPWEPFLSLGPGPGPQVSHTKLPLPMQSYGLWKLSRLSGKFVRKEKKDVFVPFSSISSFFFYWLQDTLLCLLEKNKTPKTKERKLRLLLKFEIL